MGLWVGFFVGFILGFNVHIQSKLLQHTPLSCAHTPVIDWFCLSRTGQ